MMGGEHKRDAAERTPPIPRLCLYLSERSPQPMVAVEGTTHAVSYVNPAFARLVGKPRNELIGRPFADAVPEGGANGCLAVLDRVFRTGVPEDLPEQEHRDAGPRPVYWTYAVWAILGSDETPTGVMVQVTDSTESARFRRQSIAMNEALLIAATQQHELADVAGSLSTRLQESIQTRDHFLAILSHELRNPLAAIRNAVTLATRSGTRDDLEWSRDVTARQIRNFGHLIDDLLDVSRINQGKIQLRKENVDVKPILSYAIETVRPLLDSRKHELLLAITSEPLTIEVDATRFDQMLVNLLANASKYTPSGGRIELNVGMEGTEFVCRVRDNGVGIAPELLPKMFELFVQADRSLARSEGGLGIGLTLVRSLAELHGGSISAVSAGVDQGSEFILRLPAISVPEAQGPEFAGGPGPPSAQGLKVLVVDDNQDIANGMARLLSFSGYAVQVAYDGEAALAAAREHHPDIILLDIGLPGMDGYEVASILKHEEQGQAPLLIAISGYGEEQTRSHSYAVGFDHHLVKPVDIGALLEIMSHCKDSARAPVVDSVAR